MAITFNSTAAHLTAWNGPICGTCGARYLESHACSHADIVRRVNELLALLDRQPAPSCVRPLDSTRACPCRPENGGSGVCGCTLGGPQVTC